MPSLRVLLKGLALSALVASSVAAPVQPERHEEQDACGPSYTETATHPTTTATHVVTSSVYSTASAVPTSTFVPTIPASGAVPDLTRSNLTLQYVAIGRGIQNYTCSAVGKAGAAIGAIATLYDATSVAFSDETLLHTLPPVSVTHPVDQGGKFVTAGKVINLPVLGNHYFDINGTPVFNLSAHSKIIFSAKTESVAAPATADKGPLGTGAVAWLMLTDKKGYTGGTTVGLQQVYRVETAGGNSPLCTEATGVITVPYAAEYWFYN
jgi:hypothetical protein